MRVLVTGANGFVGQHVLHDLREAGHSVAALVEKPEHHIEGTTCRDLDITDADCVGNAVRDLHPDACIHLAGLAFVPMAWEKPRLALDINVGGTVNLLEAFRKHARGAHIVVVTSSEVYGRDHGTDQIIDETTTLAPSNFYGVTKVAADMSALSFANKYDMAISTARPQNHIGPGQSDRFVVSSFARQLADYAKGRTSGTMKVGNLESERDFTDVRDVARAYRLLMEKGAKGEAFNIASGKNVRIQRMLETLCKIADTSPAIAVDPEFYRATDRPALLSTEKIKNFVGWETEYPLDTTLNDIYQDIASRPESSPT